MDKIEKIEKLTEVVKRLYKVAEFKSAIDAESVATPLQIDALLYLRKHPKSIVSSLGNYLQISSSAVAQLTDRLVGSGFVARGEDKKDRRITLLSLTKEGERVFPHFYKEKIKKIKIFAPYVSEKDLDDLTRIYSKILNKLEDRNYKK